MDLTADDKVLLEILRRWQRAENAAVALSAKVTEEAQNPLIRLVAEIVQRDSLLHHRVEQMLIDDLERDSISRPSEEDFDKVWAKLTEAVNIEDRFIEWGEKALENEKARGNELPVFLLNYLLTAEKMHKIMLEDLKKLRQNHVSKKQ